MKEIIHKLTDLTGSSVSRNSMARIKEMVCKTLIKPCLYNEDIITKIFACLALFYTSVSKITFSNRLAITFKLYTFDICFQISS